MHFPDRDGQRIVARALVTLPADAGFKLAKDDKPGGPPGRRGHGGAGRPAFEEFRMRFQLPVPKPGEPLVLAIDRPLRPKGTSSMRLKIQDEVSGAEARIFARLPGADGADARADARRRAPAASWCRVAAAAGADSLLLLPPPRTTS